MRLVKAGFERITEKDPIKKIEQVARVCYKSEDKICEGSAEKMVRSLVRSKHYSMLEHGSIIMEASIEGYTDLKRLVDKIKEEYGVDVMLRFTDVCYSGRFLISGNMRMWLELIDFVNENDELILDVGVYNILKREEYKPIFDNYTDMQVRDAGAFMVVQVEDLTHNEKLVHEDLSIKFIVDRGVSHEIVRHRKASFAQESTRYCNYGKSGEVAFILPCFLGSDRDILRGVWEHNCSESEIAYHTMIQLGAKPQEARDVLSTSVKTEVVMTANLNEWIHFFDLRALGTTGAPHPQMLEVAVPAMQDVISDHKFLEDYLEV